LPDRLGNRIILKPW